jgi:predicted Zn-dependent peptidase
MKLETWTLPNGLRAIAVPLHDTKAISVSIYAKVGSRYETRDINGVSHFIEHLVFKGTKKRPSKLALTKLLDGVGADYNAATSKDWTGFFVKISADKAELAIDVLSDLVRNALFRPADINQERGVIFEEINMYEDNPLMTIGDIFEEVLFGDHHPLGRLILGTKDVIKSVNRQKIVAYRDLYYQARNMRLVIAGKLPDNYRELVKKYFGPVKARAKFPPMEPYRSAAHENDIKLQYKEMEQTQIALGVRGLNYRDPQLPTLNVLTNILGGNASSRLFLEVREKRGLAYFVGAGINPYEDTGAVEIRAGLDKAKLNEALRVIVDELSKLKKTPVKSTELKRAKENIVGRTILDIEDSDSLAGWYARQSLFHSTIESPDEALAKIKKVTAADIQRLAQRLFKPATMRLAVIGPYQDVKPWRKIIHSV